MVLYLGLFSIENVLLFYLSCQRPTDTIVVKDPAVKVVVR